MSQLIPRARASIAGLLLTGASALVALPDVAAAGDGTVHHPDCPGLVSDLAPGTPTPIAGTVYVKAGPEHVNVGSHPAGYVATSPNEHAVSHVDVCPPGETTTTTVPDETTSTTTTVPDETTTTTTTTDPGTTTTDPGTPTTAPATTQPPTTNPPTLPATGSTASTTAAVASALVLLGGTVLLTVRRRQVG